MKLRTGLNIVLASAIGLVTLVGCGGTAKTYSEESLGLRKTNLYTENQSMTKGTNYSKDAAGTSKKIERAFDNAPPMIPHDVEGMLPIETNNNQCIGCHAPAVASSVGAVPYPASHMMNYRPTTSIGADGRIIKEDQGIDNTSDIKAASHDLGSKLYQGRFNCSQCHAPQAMRDDVPENTFQGGFRDESGKTGSNLIDTINEGVE